MANDPFVIGGSVSGQNIPSAAPPAPGYKDPLYWPGSTFTMGGNTPAPAAPAPAPEPAPAPAPAPGYWPGSTFTMGGNSPSPGPAPAAPASAPAPSPFGMVGSGSSPAPASAPAPGSGGIVGSQRSAAQVGAPSAWNVTPEQTVEGRINALTDPNSPIIAQARARAMDQANARGLANSSLAMTAADSAAYDAAIPIAQADAATAAKAAGYNADQANQVAMRNADYENQFRLQDKADAQAREIAMINRETQKQLTTLDASLRAQADAIASQNKTMLETNAQAASAFNTAMSAINNIQNNNQMDADAKTMSVASVWRDLQTQLRVMSSVSGLDLTSQLNFANYPGFDANGNFVGFEDGPGARTRNGTAAPSVAAPPPPAAPGQRGYLSPDYTGAGA
jgi:hypothetical protein